MVARDASLSWCLRAQARENASFDCVKMCSKLESVFSVPKRMARSMSPRLRWPSMYSAGK